MHTEDYWIIGIGIAVLIPVLILILLFLRSNDHKIITGKIAARRGTFISKQFHPLGFHVTGRRGNRCYTVIYKDMHGNTRKAKVQCMLLGDIWFISDTIIEHSATPSGNGDTRKEHSRPRARKR